MPYMYTVNTIVHWSLMHAPCEVQYYTRNFVYHFYSRAVDNIISTYNVDPTYIL